MARISLLRSGVLALGAGCSFGSPTAPKDAPPDGPGDGAMIDARDDAMPSACMTRWRNNTVMLRAPTKLTTLSSSDEDGDLFLSADELTLYFSSPRSPALNEDVFIAKRPTTGVAFPAAVQDLSANSPAADYRLTMTSNELIAVVASTRNPTEGNSDLLYATRTLKTEPWGTFAKTHGLPNINGPDDEVDPELSGDGLHLYLARGNPRRIARSVRSDTASTFSSPQDLPELLSGEGDADPTVSGDELLIVFSSRRNGSNSDQLWYATRSSKTSMFGPAVLVPAVNTVDFSEVDPAISSDGCRLYFASDRDGNYDLWFTEMM